MRRYDSMSDDQLVELYSLGTNEAFDTLLLRYDAYVHTTIRYWVTDEDLVEDVFQDTFIKVMMTIRQGRYTAEGKFRSWIGRIAHNLIMDHFRRQRARGQEQTIEGASGEELQGDSRGDRREHQYRTGPYALCPPAPASACASVVLRYCPLPH